MVENANYFNYPLYPFSKWLQFYGRLNEIYFGFFDTFVQGIARIPDTKQYPYHQVLVAGTFDRLHIGHKAILEEAFDSGKYVHIGLMSDQYIEKSAKARSGVSSYPRRLELLEEYLKVRGVYHRTNVFSVDDPLNTPVLNNPGLEAIIVSDETIPGALSVNHKRRADGLSDLDIISVNRIRDVVGEVVSSTRIRSGQIDRLGRLLYGYN